MPVVKVWNDNVYEYKETFKGELKLIPAKGYIEMEYEDAIDFKGAYSPIITDGNGNHLPQGFKMIRVEQPPVIPAPELKLVNHATGAIAATPEALRAMLLEHSHLNVKDESAEKSLAEELAAARAEIERLKAQPPKNLGGRPPKQATA